MDSCAVKLRFLCFSIGSGGLVGRVFCGLCAAALDYAGGTAVCLSNGVCRMVGIICGAVGDCGRWGSGGFARSAVSFYGSGFGRSGGFAFRTGL